MSLSNNYKVLRGFLDSQEAQDLGKEYIDYCEKYVEVNEDGNRQNFGYISFLELLVAKTPEVNWILGEKVLPTYCYGRVYYNGNILKPHVDRLESEIAITVHLSSDEPWDIWVRDPSGNKNYVTLTYGDAMIYNGMTAEHGRDPFMGQYHANAFLFYNRSRGQYSVPWKQHLRKINEH